MIQQITLVPHDQKVAPPERVVTLAVVSCEVDPQRWVQWQWPTWHLVHEIECDGDLVVCRCGTYCYRHEQRLVAFTGVDPTQGRCLECESR